MVAAMARAPMKQVQTCQDEQQADFEDLVEWPSNTIELRVRECVADTDRFVGCFS